ncbi:MAG: endonuclease VIII [Gammaproteobacteria bacterium]|nr:endonuclease VIII [Gammaproteobacteria bacterium]
MPEGPEIRRAADELAAALTGERIEKILFAFAALKRYESEMIGARIQQVSSRGKAILNRLDNGLTIYSHNQLYGRWQILPAGPYPESTRQLRLAIHTDSQMALLYSASDITVLDSVALQGHPYLIKLGPELLDPSVTLDEIKDRFNQKQFQRRGLLGLLQDQQFISGMGNYLCCEVLHLSKIWPERRLIDLTTDERDTLAENCLKLTRQSYQTAGVTNHLQHAEQLQFEGKTFEESRFLLYRRAGEPCYQCGGTIVKAKFCGRMGYVCPTCQISTVKR